MFVFLPMFIHSYTFARPLSRLNIKVRDIAATSWTCKRPVYLSAVGIKKEELSPGGRSSFLVAMLCGYVLFLLMPDITLQKRDRVLSSLPFQETVTPTLILKTGTLLSLSRRIFLYVVFYLCTSYWQWS